MSTKIYNGYCINKTLTIPQAVKFLRKFRTNIRSACKKIVMRRVADLAVEVVDRRALKMPTKAKDFESGLGHAAHDVNDGYMEAYNKMERSCYDYECGLALLAGCKKTLVMLFAEQPEYKDVLLSMEGVEEYPYWDNTDEPKNMTRKAWKARGREWDEALGYGIDEGGHTPEAQGLNMKCIGRFNLPIPYMQPELLVAETMKYLPTFEQRVREMAVERVLSKRVKAKVKKTGENALSVAFESLRWVEKSDEGKKAIEKESVKVREKLKKVLTIEDLKAKIA
jgi:hypothetical protein